MRAAVSCLGHATVSMALNIYADVGPNAKRATVSTEQDCLDVDTAASPIECELFGNEPDLQPVAPTFTSTSSRPCSPRREPSRAERSRPPRKRHSIRRFPSKPAKRRLEIMAGGIKPRPLDTISDHKRGRGRC
jgi:hypothetical protein